MMKVSLQNIKLLEVIDEKTSEIFTGGWQEWYGVWWKRMSGCGPTVVSTIFGYMNRCQSTDGDCIPTSRVDFVRLMDEVWRFVTPGMRGIPSTSALIKGTAGYIKAHELSIKLETLDIPKRQKERPSLTQVIDFLRPAFEQDSPVAFLSLDKGAETTLDSWHWVTLLSLEYEPDGSAALIGVADEGKHFTADLKKWYDTTPLGGGFVRFIRV